MKPDEAQYFDIRSGRHRAGYRGGMPPATGLSREPGSLRRAGRAWLRLQRAGRRSTSRVGRFFSRCGNTVARPAVTVTNFCTGERG